ncbi:MAG TPA: DUF4435 domain-containing protein [Abditibacterium sp.]
MMPEFTSTSSVDYAEIKLYHGYQEKAEIERLPLVYKRRGRWKGKPDTALLEDFSELMVVLFSEDYEVCTHYRQSQRNSDSLLPIPETRLDKIRHIWQSLLPHRELIIGGGKIETQVRESGLPSYNGSEMSDGERVTFYLIGQALSAPQNGVIIIDEPELHLHKSIQTRLWREIQAARPDCLFVYMTHDVEFAASLTEAKKIWLKSYNGTVWDWEEVPNVEEFPEALLLQILGSRQSVLFVEGDEGSYDVDLFRVLYPNHLVIPRGSCSQVISATNALREAKAQTHKEAHGIIDRDRRLPGEIAKLKAQGVEVLDVAEVENLFCVPEVLIWVAQHLGFASPEQKLEAAKSFAFEILSKELDKQISQHVGEEIARQLKQFEISKQGLPTLQKNFDFCVNGIDVNAIYAEKETEFKSVLTNKNYGDVLRLLNHKGLAAGLSGIFGVTKLPETVIRLANNGKQQELRQALSLYTPNWCDGFNTSPRRPQLPPRAASTACPPRCGTSKSAVIRSQKWLGERGALSRTR